MATLFDYYKKQGKSLPSIQERTLTASKAGIKNYSGTASENATLLAYLNKPQSVTQNITNQTRQGVVDQNNLEDEEVIGAGPNAGLTPSQVAERDRLNPPTFNSTMPTITRRAGESLESYKERIRNQPFIFAGGESANSYNNPDLYEAKKTGKDYVNVDSTQEKGTGAITDTKKYVIANEGNLSADPNTVQSYYNKLGLQNYDSEIDNSINNRIKKLQEEGETDIDEEKIRKSFKERIQSSIDAINQTYSSMLAKAKVRGENNQGVSRAISARSGLLGSSFDEANVANISKANQDTENSIEGERMSLVQQAINDAEDKATNYIKDLRQSREDANTKLMDSILTRETRTAGKASKLAQYLLTQGFTNLDELTADDQAQIAKNYGVDPETLAVEFEKALLGKRTSELALNKDRYKSISDGTQLYDTETGKIIENTKNFATKGGTSTGSSGSGYGVDANGKKITISKDAQIWVDKINREGGKVSDYITGTSIVAQNLRNEVQAGLNAQGGVGSFDKAKNMQLIDVVDSTIQKLADSKDLVGTFRTRNADSKWLNWTSNKNTSFVNQVDKLQGQLLKLDGVALKAIFGPQISNSDAQTIKEIVGNALDPKNQTPEDFQQSLDDITQGLAEYRKNNSVAPVTVDTGAEYDYARDLKLAQDAIARGADKTQVMARFNAKYK